MIELEAEQGRRSATHADEKDRPRKEDPQNEEQDAETDKNRADHPENATDVGVLAVRWVASPGVDRCEFLVAHVPGNRCEQLAEDQSKDIPTTRTVVEPLGSG